MKKFLLLLIIFCAPLSAYAIKVDKQVVRIFSQVVTTGFPEGWKPASRHEQPGHFMLEFIPENEDIKNWNNLFSIQGFQNLAAKADAKIMIGLAGVQQKEICGENFVFEPIHEQHISGYEAHGAIIGCSSIPKDLPIGLKKGMSEIGYYIAIRGKKDNYLFHKNIRGNAFDKDNPPLTKENAKDFINDFMPIELVDP